MKKLQIKLLKICGIILLILLTGIITLIIFTGPELPDNTDMIIDQVLTSKLPEFIKGESGYVTSDNYKIWYESIVPQDTIKGSLLLFMGMATDALGWPQPFIDIFVDSGYHVIRFDYRGTGMSDMKRPW